MRFTEQDSLAVLKQQEQKMAQIIDSIYFNTYEYRPSQSMDTKKLELSRMIKTFAVLYTDHQQMLYAYEKILLEKKDTK